MSSFGDISGKRVSNTWVTYPQAGDNVWKQALIPDGYAEGDFWRIKLRRLGRGLWPIS